MIACVQQTDERPKLIQLIHRQLTADDGVAGKDLTCVLMLSCALRDVMDMQRDYAADHNTWRLLQVLFNATSFPSTGQVIMYSGSRQHLYAAKRLFEDFF